MAEIEKGNPEMAQDLTTRKANLQFVFPFLLQEEKIEGFAEKLLEKGFVFFDLENMEQENQFYGSDSVSHRSMEKYFMPNIEPIVFPATYKRSEGLRRFTKKLIRSLHYPQPFSLRPLPSILSISLSVLFILDL